MLQQLFTDKEIGFTTTTTENRLSVQKSSVRGLVRLNPGWTREEHLPNFS